MVCLAARADPVGEGIAGQDSKEAICAYYVDTPSEDEEGATAEAQVDDALEDLKLLFQEQLTALAEDIAEQQALRKGKAVATDPSPPQDHSSIMVLEEEAVAAPTRPDEFITPQPQGGFRWFMQHMPRTGSTYGDSTQISRPEDSYPPPALLVSTSENAEEGTAVVTAQTVTEVTVSAVPAV